MNWLNWFICIINKQFCMHLHINYITASAIVTHSHTQWCTRGVFYPTEKPQIRFVIVCKVARKMIASKLLQFKIYVHVRTHASITDALKLKIQIQIMRLCQNFNAHPKCHHLGQKLCIIKSYNPSKSLHKLHIFGKCLYLQQRQTDTLHHVRPMLLWVHFHVYIHFNIHIS